MDLHLGTYKTDWAFVGEECGFQVKDIREVIERQTEAYWNSSEFEQVPNWKWLGRLYWDRGKIEKESTEAEKGNYLIGYSLKLNWLL